MSKLTKEESEILEAYESGTTKSVQDVDELRERHKEYAAATFRKDARISIRLSAKDLRALQKRALAEGIPCETFVSSILHKYAEGRMRETG